jgi:hypothetical protein
MSDESKEPEKDPPKPESEKEQISYGVERPDPRRESNSIDNKRRTPGP